MMIEFLEAYRPNGNETVKNVDAETVILAMIKPSPKKNSKNLNGNVFPQQK